MVCAFSSTTQAFVHLAPWCAFVQLQSDVWFGFDIYIYVCICVYICIYMHICICVYAYIYMHICMYVYAYTYVERETDVDR